MSSIQSSDVRVSEISLHKLPFCLIAITGVIALLGVFQAYFVSTYGIETPLKDLRHISLDDELNIGAWYSSFLMLFIAAMSLLNRIMLSEPAQDKPRWTILGLAFTYMAIDEALAIHEVFIEPLRSLLDTGGIFYFAWVIPGIFIVGILGLYFLPFILRQPRPFNILFFLSGTLYVSGAIGAELVGGLAADTLGYDSLMYTVAMLIEETLELTGLTLFSVSLIYYARHHHLEPHLKY